MLKRPSIDGSATFSRLSSVVVTVSERSRVFQRPNVNRFASLAYQFVREQNYQSEQQPRIYEKIRRRPHAEPVRMADLEQWRNFDPYLSRRTAAHRTKLSGKHFSSDYLLKKRRPFTLSRNQDKDIFVTNKTNFRTQLKKCEELLENGESEIIIHGLGAAIQRACSLALQLKLIHRGTIDLDIKTSSVPIIDDLEPLTDDVDYDTNNRQNSAIHIRVFKTFLIGGLRNLE